MMLLGVFLIAVSQWAVVLGQSSSEDLTQTDYIIIGVTSAVAGFVIIGAIIYGCMQRSKSKKARNELYQKYLDSDNINFTELGTANLGYTGSSTQVSSAPNGTTSGKKPTGVSVSSSEGGIVISVSDNSKSKTTSTYSDSSEPIYSQPSKLDDYEVISSVPPTNQKASTSSDSEKAKAKPEVNAYENEGISSQSASYKPEEEGITSF